ncbi:MAG: flavoprotein, partial [Candidatus Baltobacteraceae bacterium]
DIPDNSVAVGVPARVIKSVDAYLERACQRSLHLGHLRTLTQLAEIGATILPPVPAMYANPQTVGDIVNHTVGKALDQFGVDAALFTRWSSPAG